jgi:hypothetical protein
MTEAKATGLQQVRVNFNKTIDTEKAKKGTAATTVIFAEVKKSAVLTLVDDKISEGDYTANLSGLDAAVVDKTTVTFAAENEKITKLNFVNNSDKIVKSTKVVVNINAENQYGEVASTNGGIYMAYVAGETKIVLRNEDTGLLELTLDTSSKKSEIDVIAVNLFLRTRLFRFKRLLKWAWLL